MNAAIRSSHRWLSIVFMIAVVINVAAAVMKVQEVWIGLLALFPLILMMLSGMWLFILPFLARRKTSRR